MKKNGKKILKLFTLIGVLIGIISIINKVIYYFSNIKNKLTNSHSYYYQWKFGKIHYILKGTGKPILLIHGLENGNSSYEFGKLINTLSKRNKVFAIDLLGYGNSEKVNITYTGYIYVQLINDFIKYVINENTDILAIGKSSSYAIMTCYQKNQNINKLILVNPTNTNILSMNPTKKDKILKYIIELPLLGTSIYNFISSKYIIKKLINKNISSSQKKKYIEAFYEASHTGGANNKYSYASNKYKYTNINIINPLRELNNSIYIINSSYYTNVIDSYKNINPSIEAFTIDKCKNYPHIENPHSMLEILSVLLYSQ